MDILYLSYIQFYNSNIFYFLAQIVSALAIESSFHVS